MKDELNINADAIQGYKIRKKIGEGGMGEVYLAEQLSLKREVAIKFLTKLSEKEKRRLSLQHEAVLMAKFSHPNIVAVYDCGKVDEGQYMVMEYVKGDSLRQHIDKALSVERTRTICQAIARALLYLHEHGVMHHDLKPENILIDGMGNLFITDFGIAQLVLGSEGEQAPVWAGTLDYAAPEVRHRLDVDERADQFSFAVIVYEMLTGKKPSSVPKPPSSVNHKLPKEVDEVVLKALSQEPDERYFNIREFGQSLDAALAGAVPESSVMTKVAGAVLALMVLVVGGTYAISRLGSQKVGPAQEREKLFGISQENSEEVSEPEPITGIETISLSQVSDIDRVVERASEEGKNIAWFFGDTDERIEDWLKQVSWNPELNSNLAGYAAVFPPVGVEEDIFKKFGWQLSSVPAVVLKDDEIGLCRFIVFEHDESIFEAALSSSWFNSHGSEDIGLKDMVKNSSLEEEADRGGFPASWINAITSRQVKNLEVLWGSDPTDEANNAFYLDSRPVGKEHFYAHHSVKDLCSTTRSLLTFRARQTDGKGRLILTVAHVAKEAAGDLNETKSVRERVELLVKSEDDNADDVWTFRVGVSPQEKWQEYNVVFAKPPEVVGRVMSVLVSIKGKGRFWVDDIKLYEW